MVDMFSNIYPVILGLLFLIWSVESNEVEFGDVERILILGESFPLANDSIIYVLHEDTEQPGKFIIGIETALFSTRLLDTGNQEVQHLVGKIEIQGFRDGVGSNVLFRSLRDLVQVPHGYIVSDSGNDCLRLVTASRADKDIWRTDTYAGTCEQEGSIGGRRFNAKFHNPYGLVLSGNLLYITDTVTKKLRQLNMVTGLVTTVHESENFKLLDFVLGEKKEFYVVAQNGILRIQDNKEAWVVGCAEYVHQTVRSQFSGAKFSKPEAIERLTEDILLVTDSETNTVKVVDISIKQVDVICYGYDYVDGPTTSCSLIYPGSLRVVGDVILIGEAGGVRKLPFYRVASRTGVDTTAETPPGGQPMLPPPGGQPAMTPNKTSTHQGTCQRPPTIPNAMHTELDRYDEGTQVGYYCIDSYTRRSMTSSMITCASAIDGYYWIGGNIDCQPSAALVATIAMAVVFVLLAIALLVASVKLSKQTRKQSTRQTSSDNEQMQTTSMSLSPTRGSLPTPPEEPQNVSSYDYPTSGGSQPREFDGYLQPASDPEVSRPGAANEGHVSLNDRSPEGDDHTAANDDDIYTGASVYSTVAGHSN